MKNSPLRSFARLAGVAAVLAMLSAPAAAQQTFQSPEQAAESLAAALRAGDQKALVTLLGPGSEDVISSGDAVDDDNVRKAFLLAYDLKHSVQTKDGKATLLIGREDYPFSIPDREERRGLELRRGGRPGRIVGAPHRPQ